MTDDPTDTNDSANERGLLARILRKSADELEEPGDGGTGDGTPDAPDADQKGDYGDDDDDDDDEEMKSNPIDAAIAAGDLPAEKAELFRAKHKKMDVTPFIDAISENDLDVEDAVDLLNAVDYDDDMSDDTPADGKAAPDGDQDDPGTEQKASMMEVAEAMAEYFDASTDEVMEFLDDLDVDQAAGPEKDAAGELKAAAIEEAVDDAVDDAVEEKLDERLGALEDTFEQKLDDIAGDIDDEVMTKSEFDDLIQRSDMVGSPVPTQSTGNGEEQTFAEKLRERGGVAGGDN